MREIVVRGEQGKIVLDAQPGDQRVDGAELDAAASPSVAPSQSAIHLARACEGTLARLPKPGTCGFVLARHGWARALARVLVSAETKNPSVTFSLARVNREGPCCNKVYIAASYSAITIIHADPSPRRPPAQHKRGAALRVSFISHIAYISIKD